MATEDPFSPAPYRTPGVPRAQPEDLWLSRASDIAVFCNSASSYTDWGSYSWECLMQLREAFITPSPASSPGRGMNRECTSWKAALVVQWAQPGDKRSLLDLQPLELPEPLGSCPAVASSASAIC